MKFKHLLLTASVMALFSSCSNDELVSESTSHGDAIAFSVTTTNATRAADYWCNSQPPKYFEVSAAYNNAFYFNNEVYSKGSTGTYGQDDGNYRYWPDLSTEKPLYVYAYKVKADGDNAIVTPGFATFSWTAANEAPTITMTPATAAAAQHDLLYAYTKVTEKPGFGKTANINFRHALSQIVFYAKCENTKVYVEIQEIALINAATSGKFTLPTGDNVTDENLEKHDQTGTFETKHKGFGTWALTYNKTNKANRSYTASCLKSDGNLTALTPGAGVDAWTNLTDNTKEANDTHKAYNQSLLVLPHGKNTDNPENKLAAYVPKKDDGTYQPLTDQTVGESTIPGVGGACIAIKCKIRNISGKTSPVDENDVYLWGSAGEAKDLVIPVDFAWEQGKKYIYRINFSNTGHGGYDPDNGKEVLVPIQLSVKVDDFAEVTEITPNF